MGIPLKILIDRPRNKVVWAECKKEFVDFIHSILDLPIGSLVALDAATSKESAARNAYNSIPMLSTEYKDNYKELAEKVTILSSHVVPMLGKGIVREFYICTHCKRHISDGTDAWCPICESYISGGVVYTEPPPMKRRRHKDDEEEYIVLDNLTFKAHSFHATYLSIDNFDPNLPQNYEQKKVDFGAVEIQKLLNCIADSTDVLTQVYLRPEAPAPAAAAAAAPTNEE